MSVTRRRFLQRFIDEFCREVLSTSKRFKDVERFYEAEKPPSTAIFCPVMYAEASLSRNAIVPIMSASAFGRRITTRPRQIYQLRIRLLRLIMERIPT